MPATTSRGYPYPVGGDAPDGAGAMQNLANAINTDVAALFALLADTGWQNITVVNSPYTATGLQYRVKANAVVVRGTMTRGSGSVVVGDIPFVLPASTFPTGSTLYRVPFVASGTVSGFLNVGGPNGNVTVGQVSGTTSSIVPSQVPVPLD